jgi:hypothetical protein
MRSYITQILREIEDETTPFWWIVGWPEGGGINVSVLPRRPGADLETRFFRLREGLPMEAAIRAWVRCNS